MRRRSPRAVRRLTCALALLAVAAISGCGGTRPAPEPATTGRAPVAERPYRRPVPRPAPPERPPVPAAPAGTLEARPAAVGAPLVFHLTRASVPTRGLAGQHVALWPSHGLYYNQERDRWIWQRARLFTSLEDVLPFAIVEPYLAPMLERAGAVVLMPRERDVQPVESVADNDGGAAVTGRYAEHGAWRDAGPGFAHRPPYRDGDAPFALGTARETATSRSGTADATWTFDVPAVADYAVHVAWTPGADRADDARYAVEHAGGTSHVVVNQTMGGGTWVYLGTFPMRPGLGRVTLSNYSATPGRTVSADAARIGGGMGHVVRGSETSRRPRWTEASRYYQQWAGAPRHVYATASTAPDARGPDDYKDDYMSRGEWVNWLRASPAGGDGFGPERFRDAPGLGIPVRAVLALHTDAGQTSDSTAYGTLLIHDTAGLDRTGTFPDGTSRVATTALAERLLETVVHDVQALYDPGWPRRGRRNRAYSEASRPNVPAALVELLAHQNYEDMRLALDPRAQFDLARALYKALGRWMVGPSFVVQPLAPDGLAATFAPDGSVRLSWAPVADPLEPSADPTAYVLYRRTAAGGWDSGALVHDTEVGLPPPAPGTVHAYRVAAVNAGGESAPSASIAVGLPEQPDAPSVLVVAAWDRVAGPEPFEAIGPDGQRLLGFRRERDPGVPDVRDLLTVGDQTEFDRRRPWRSDDDPGHGASRGDRLASLARGNAHDAAEVQVEALVAAGVAAASATDEAVERGAVRLDAFDAVSLSLGLERRTPWPRAADPRPWRYEALPRALRDRLGAYLDGDGRLLVSGAYWASDAAATPDGADWLARRLGVRPSGEAEAPALASVAGGAPDAGLLPDGTTVAIATEGRPDAFAVVRPDALAPAGGGASVLRFASGGTSGVATPQTVSLSVPVEALPDAWLRARVLGAALRLLLTR